MEFTQENFEQEIINNQGVVLVDFYAPWCGPCKMIAPIIDELKNEYNKDDKVKIGNLNVDENQQIAEKYNIMGVPTIIIFKNGKIVEQIVGMRPKENLQELLEKYKKI